MSIYRFDDFRFDSTRAQLTRDGQDLKLRPQSARFLAFVLQNRERLITKEELIAEVWGESFVNDQAVFQCVNQLRKALGESAGDPKYLRTVPRRGYRWIAERVTEEEPAAVAEPVEREQTPPEPEVHAPDSQGLSVTGQLRVVRKQRVGWMTAALAMATVLLILVLLTLPGLLEQKPAPRGRLALLPFANDTGDPQLHWVELGLMDMVLQSFKENASLSPISTERVLNALKDSGLRQGQIAAGEQLKQLRTLLGAEQVIGITVRGRRQAYELVCQTVNHRQEVDTQIFSGTDLTDLALRVSGELQSVLTGERKPVARSFSKDSFVNQSYALGLQEYYEGYLQKALPYFEVCLQKDPNFLFAAYQLANCRMDLGLDGEAEKLARETLTKARASGDTVAGDLLLILGDLEGRKGNTAQALANYREALDLWQNLGDREGEWVALMNLAAEYATQPDTIDQGIETYREALALALEIDDEHGQAQVYGSLGLVELGRGRIEEGLAFLEKELGIWEALDHPDAEAYVHQELGHHYLFHDQREKGRTHLTQAVELARQTQSKPVLITALTALGEMAIEEENWPEARKYLDEAAELAAPLGNPGQELEVRLMQAKLASLEPDAELMELSGNRAATLARQLTDRDSEIYVLAAFGDCHYNSDDREAGRTYLEKVEKLAGPEHPISLLLRARDAYEHDRFQDAFEKQKDVKTRWPEIWDRREEMLLTRYRRAAETGRRGESPVQ
ncbi:MAG: winged helix-turn-helix domain-containing protein [Acidobacteriota bacterium]|nr:winged helix-turn-helix domain-containing protein [Acidobacteriota bacterium]